MVRFFNCHIRLEIYTIDSVESLISNTDLVFDLKGEMKLKTIEKHHYVLHLIIRSNLIRNLFQSYINIPSKQLKRILGRDYISIIKNLEELNIINIIKFFILNLTNVKKQII